jgi:hypothetical protein
VGLCLQIEAAFAEAAVAYPNTTGMTVVAPSQTLTVDGVTIGFDVTGALSTLSFGGMVVATSTNPMGRYQYDTFNTTVLDQYPICCWWDPDQRQNISHAQATSVFGAVQQVFKGPRTLLAVMQMPSLQHVVYGAPDIVRARVPRRVTSPSLFVAVQVHLRCFALSESVSESAVSLFGCLFVCFCACMHVLTSLLHSRVAVRVQVTINATIVDAATVVLDVQLFNVTKTRLAGAHYLHFLPAAVANSGPWMMNKLGSWIDPLDMVNKGSQHQHTVGDGGVRNANIRCSCPLRDGCSHDGLVPQW